jgi:hypothetical protein
MMQFARYIVGIDVDLHRADRMDGGRRHYKFGTVRQHQGNTIARFDAADLLQETRKRTGLIPDLRKGQRVVLLHDRGRPVAIACTVGEQVAQIGKRTQSVVGDPAHFAFLSPLVP